jgi:hypothetical protein
MRRRIFCSKRDEGTRVQRNLNDEGLHNLLSSPNIIVMIKSRKMNLAGHVARMGQMRSAYKILVRKSLGKSTLGIIGVDVSIILKCISRNSGGSVWTGSNWFRMGARGGLV